MGRSTCDLGGRARFRTRRTLDDNVAILAEGRALRGESLREAPAPSLIIRGRVRSLKIQADLGEKSVADRLKLLIVFLVVRHDYEVEEKNKNENGSWRSSKRMDGSERQSSKLENLIPVDDIRGNALPVSGSPVGHVPHPRIPMSTLAKDAAAFKTALVRQDYTSWHSNPGPPQLPGETPAEESGEKKKKKKSKHSAHHLQSLPDETFECPSSQTLCIRSRRTLARETMSTRSWSMQSRTSRSECVH
jgi:hypothetical protein